MSIDERPVALPKLYGAPAYARPPVAVAAVPRPFNPDEFPLAVEQTDEDRASMAYIYARTYETRRADRGRPETHRSGSGGLRARSFSVRAIAGRLARRRPVDGAVAVASVEGDRTTAGRDPASEHDGLVGEGGLEPPTSEV